MTDPTPVEILEIRDRPIEVRLADGAIIHFRPQVVSVTRQDTDKGEAAYNIQCTNHFHLVRPPDEKPLNKPIPLKPVS